MSNFISLSLNELKKKSWQRNGVIFPENKIPNLYTHAAVPVINPLFNQNFTQVFFSARDRKQHSHPLYFLCPHDQFSEVHSICNEPILPLGAPGTFDENGIMPTYLVQNYELLYMYYIGWNQGKSIPFRNALGLAISEDRGLNWKKISTGPILDRSIYDPCFVASACVLVDEGIWRMWYLSCINWTASSDGFRHHYHIKYAESVDGIEWKRSGIICIDFEMGEYAISRPTVIKTSDGYLMLFSARGDKYRIFAATSNDGIKWTRTPNLSVRPTEEKWENESVEYPICLVSKSNEIHLLYNGNGYGKTGIGWATLC